MTHDTGCNQGRNSPGSHASTVAVYRAIWDFIRPALGPVVLIALAMGLIALPSLLVSHFWRM